jgi:MFS family permease
VRLLRSVSRLTCQRTFERSDRDGSSIGPKLIHYNTPFDSSLGSITYGYDLGVIAGVIVAPAFLDRMDNPSADYTGFIVSSMLLGALCGSVPAALVADKFSRRMAILTFAIVFLLGGSLQTGAMNRGMM